MSSATFSYCLLHELPKQSFVFFLAGFETSSTLMAFALHELALNKEIQDKARDEIKNVLDKHEGLFSYEAMMDMNYLTQILNGLFIQVILLYNKPKYQNIIQNP